MKSHPKQNLVKVRRRGMTLIELMIIVVIIGIVFTFAFVNAGANTEKSKYARAEADLDALTQAVAVYMQNTNTSAASKWMTPQDVRSVYLINPLNMGCRQSKTSGATTVLDKYLTQPYAKIYDPWGKHYNIDNEELDEITISCESYTTNPYNNEPLVRKLHFDD